MKGTPLVILAFIGIFIAGALTGGVLTVQYLQVRSWRRFHDAPPPRFQHPMQRPPTGPEQFYTQFMRRFTRELDLTPEQVKTIGPIVRDAAEKLHSLRSETAHSTELIFKQVDDQISTVLTPAQHDRFTELIQAQRERIRRYNLEQQDRRRDQPPPKPQEPAPSPAPAQP